MHIQIKKYSYLLLIFILGMSSCKEDTVGPIFNDLAYFVEGQLSLNVKENDNSLLVPVTHRNHANDGKTKFRVDMAEGTSASLFEVGTFEADFSESDTIWVEVNFSFDQLIDDAQYSISLTIEEGDGYLQPMLFDDGNFSCEIGFTKYIPFQTSNFEASYTAVGLSAFSESDVIFDVTLTYVGPDDEDASKHIYAIDNFYNVDGGLVLIKLNTVDNTLSCPSQFFKDDYLAVYNDATGSFMNSGSTFTIGELQLVDYSQGVYLDIFEEGIVFTKKP